MVTHITVVVVEIFTILTICTILDLGQIVEKPRGDLEKVLPREDLKPRDVPKTNPRAQPEGLPSEYPRHSDSPEGELFSDIMQGFSKILVNPQ